METTKRQLNYLKILQVAVFNSIRYWATIKSSPSLDEISRCLHEDVRRSYLRKIAVQIEYAGKPHTITLDTISLGMKRLAQGADADEQRKWRQAFHDAANGIFDFTVDDADCIVQIGLFNDFIHSAKDTLRNGGNWRDGSDKRASYRRKERAYPAPSLVKEDGKVVDTFKSPQRFEITVNFKGSVTFRVNAPSAEALESMWNQVEDHAYYTITGDNPEGSEDHDAEIELDKSKNWEKVDYIYPPPEMQFDYNAAFSWEDIEALESLEASVFHNPDVLKAISLEYGWSIQKIEDEFDKGLLDKDAISATVEDCPSEIDTIVKLWIDSNGSAYDLGIWVFRLLNALQKRIVLACNPLTSETEIEYPEGLKDACSLALKAMSFSESRKQWISICTADNVEAVAKCARFLVREVLSDDCASEISLGKEQA